MIRSVCVCASFIVSFRFALCFFFFVIIRLLCAFLSFQHVEKFCCCFGFICSWFLQFSFFFISFPSSSLVRFICMLASWYRFAFSLNIKKFCSFHWPKWSNNFILSTTTIPSKWYYRGKNKLYTHTHEHTDGILVLLKYANKRTNVANTRSKQR